MTGRAAARLARLARLLALLLSTSACLAAPIHLRDDTGAEVTLAGPAQRVVTLAPHLAELVYAAGAGQRLVGVMRYSDFPAAVARLPVIGDAFAVNLEAIAGLKPDLLLVWSSGLNPRQRDALRALGIPVFASEITGVPGIAAALRQIGRLLGTTAQAEAAATATLARWQALQASYAGRPAVRVFYQLWHEPLMTVSHAHLIDQAIRACGGVNVFADQPVLTPTVGWEAAVLANPQLVVSGASPDEPARLAGWQRFSQVDAVRRGHLVALDSAAMARMSPRFVDAAALLCAAIDRAR